MRRWLASVVECQGSGSSRRASSLRPDSPKRSETGQGRPKANSVAWMRFFKAPTWCTRWRAKASAIALAAHSSREGGEIARRHEIEARELGEHPGVDAIGLAGQGRHAFDPLGIGDRDLPAAELEGVVDEARVVHRLDGRPHWRTVCGKTLCKATQPVAVGWCRRDRQLLTVLIEQAHIQTFP